MQAIVVGSGVSGLSSAICLLEAGFAVHLITREQAAQTTSAAAGAFWYPLSMLDDEAMLRWALDTGERLAALVAVPEAGVSRLRLHEPIPEVLAEDVWQDLLAQWRQLHPDLAAMAADQLPAGYPHGIVYTTYLVEPPVYMPYLLDRFTALGGTVEMGDVAGLDDLCAPDRVVVNCTGAWAGKLTGDPHVYPIRGQIIRLAPQRQLTFGHHLFDSPLGVTYILPRVNDCVLGGTYEVGDWSRQPDDATSAAIWERCIGVEPSLAGAEVLDVRVGLRPGRHEVRLEAEQRPQGTVIHNYGHAGVGFTLSWGCAAGVVALAQQAF